MQSSLIKFNGSFLETPRVKQINVSQFFAYEKLLLDKKPTTKGSMLTENLFVRSKYLEGEQKIMYFCYKLLQPVSSIA